MESKSANLLGISTDSTLEEIHAAYRKKAGQHHPDLGGDRREFQAITAAYETMLASHEKLRLAAKDRAATEGAAEGEADSGRGRSTQPKRAHAAKATSSSNFAADPTPNRKRNSGPQRTSGTGDARSSIKHLLTGKLPLQDHTTYFILVNALDIFLTYLILTRQGVEANPIANFFFRNWNIQGMIAFKMVIVGFVCILSQVIALRSIRSASRLLIFGTVAVGCVVLYSVWLLARVF
jgi:hypothetical protein